MAKAPALPFSRARPQAAAEDRLRRAVQAHYDFLWRSLRRLGVPQAGVEDAAQQVLLVFSRRLSSVEPNAERAFLFGTAIKVAADARKKTARAPQLLGDEELEAQRHPGPNPEQQLDERRARDLLDQVLSELPDELRAVLVLAELEEMTMAAIAELLALPPGTVASRLRRARELFAVRAAALRARLGGA